ncbi:hypothetical protein ACFLQL_00340 [Verrucomicrobiota bacterium]
MLIYWNKLLTALGCQLTSYNINELHSCPFHPNSEKTLTIHTNPFTNELQFSCKKCNFSGDFLTLVSRLHNISILAAFNLFTVGNSLYHTLINELNSFQIEEYLNLRKNQVLINDYLLRCYEYLTTNPEGKQLCLYLINHQWLLSGSINQLPKEIGYVVTTEIPRVLTNLTDVEYKQAHHLIFKHTFNNIVSKLATIKLGDINKYTTIPLSATDDGIFLEANLTEDTKQIFVAQDELTALTIHTKLKAWGSNNYPIITMASPHLPAYCNKLEKIILLTTNQKPLTLATALSYFTTKNIIDNNNTTPSIYVTKINQPINKLPINTMFQIITNKQPLIIWLAKELTYTFSKIGINAIHDALKNIRLDEKQKRSLLIELSNKSCDKQLSEIIQNHQVTITEQKTLINGQMITKNKSGFVGYKANKTPIPLSNITFTIKQKIKSCTGELFCDCELISADPDIPKIQTFLPYNAFNYYKTLQHSIVKAFADVGYAPSIILYNIKEFSWLEICETFTESKIIQPELTHLGLDEYQHIQLPNIFIDLNDKTIKPQNKLFGLSDYIKKSYAAINNTEITSIKTFKNLWENHSSASYPFIAGICHIIGNIIIKKKSLTYSQEVQPRHLCFVNTLDNILNSTYTKLNTLISGKANEYRLTSYNVNKFMSTVNGMGELPLFMSLPTITAARRKILLQDTSASLVLNIPSVIAEELNEYYNIVFVTGKDTTQLTTEIVFDLQREFVSFIVYLMASPLFDKYAEQIISSCSPQIETFEFVAEQLKIDVSKHNMIDSVKAYYIDDSNNIVKSFFSSLSKVTGNTVKHPVKLISVKDKPSTTMLATKDLNIYATNKYVYIKKSLTEILNKQNTQYNFRQRKLTNELERAGLLEGHVANYWILTKNKWDKLNEPDSALIVNQSLS